MVFEVVPNQGIAGLGFGTPRAEVRRYFGNGHREFRRSPAAASSDHWPQVAVFAYYDGAETLEALEFAPPAELRLEGQDLFALDGRAMREILSAMDGAMALEEDGLVSERLGLGIWTNAPPRDGAPQSILVFRPGYYR